jgi:hypothetical protein
VIVGEYLAPDRESGFVRDRRGRITRIDLPGAAGTQVDKINDRGQIAASASTPTADDPFAGARGFVLRDGIEGPFTEVRFPGAPRTIATGMDDRGRIVGVYENPNYQSPTATPRPRPALDQWPPEGRMFWLSWNRLVGSYRSFTATRRA